MLETLTRGFTAAREKLGGTRELTEANVDASLRDVRMSLLEADVDFAVVTDFLTRVKQRALGRRWRRGWRRVGPPARDARATTSSRSAKELCG
jgi:signal recognition particle GTPase